LRYQLPNRELGKEYQANVIRKILERHGPDWGPAKVELRFRRDPDPPFEGKWSYQPVSSEIVRIHGRLGGYLHATAFSALSSEEDPLGAPSGPGLSEMRGDLVDCAKSLQDFICGGMRGPFDLGEYIAAHSEYLEWLRTSSDDE
jgi:hypothetical protein